MEHREISACELIATHLEHIESINPVINAIVRLDGERAMNRAARIDRLLAAGESPGVLAGVPFTVKDNMETAGIVTAIGVPERRDVIPARDATVVHRMKSAGAILLGKTNCPPWGGGLETDNPVYGRTTNPFDRNRTPGGSSGGEAAAIASGMSPCGLGTDSGGSLRYPAHFCGIAAIKPTAGMVPLTGSLDDNGQLGSIRDPRTQVGPMARSVDDLALMLDIISGPDNIDPAVVPVRLAVDGDVVRARSLRVAVQFGNDEVESTADTLATVQAAAQILAEDGADVTPVDLPDEGLLLSRDIWRSYGGAMTSAELYELFAEWDAYRSRLLVWFQDYDLILRPVNATPAAAHGAADPAALCTLPFSLTGWPAVTVRCGTSPDGLPIGVQIVAHPWQDRLALNVAAVLEKKLGGWRAPSFPVCPPVTDTSL